MYAIIETGGKQYRVQQGDVITVEKLGIEEGNQVIFDKVLAMGDGADIQIGTPYVDGATVTGEVTAEGKGKKVIIFKYKAKKDYRKKQGHRQPFTQVEILAVGDEEPVKVSAKVEAEAAAYAEPVEVDAPKKASKSLKSMKKAELIEFAKENDIEIDEKATNAVMIETIEAALEK